MWVRSTATSSAYAGPHTWSSSAPWVIRRPRFAHQGLQQVELDRGQVDLRSIAPHGVGGDVELEAVGCEHRLSASAPARRSAASRRAISSRGPNGLVT